MNEAHCPDFIDNYAWPPNSPDFNALDYHVWGRLNPQPKNIPEMKTALLMTLDELPQEAIRTRSSIELGDRAPRKPRIAEMDEEMTT